jgi:hypothetical protein
MCVGSVAGAVSWGANMQINTLNFDHLKVASSNPEFYSTYASIQRWQAAFYIMYGMEFLSFIIPKLMMLGRLTENTTGSSKAKSVDMDRVRRQWRGGSDGLRRRALPMLFRAMAAAVVVCSVVGMVANCRASAYYVQSAWLLDEAATSCAITVNCSLYLQSYSIRDKAHTAYSVQSMCEAVALMITALSYLLLVVRSVALYRRAERVVATALLSLSDKSFERSTLPAVFAEADYTGSADSTVQLETSSAVEVLEGTQKAAADKRWRLIAACAIVLLSFPARAAFDLLQAYSNINARLHERNPLCGPCDACQSEQYLINTWIVNTPEFQPIVVAVSSPLPMMWSLWLMMSAWERRHMRRGIDMNKTGEQQQVIAARARLGIDFPRPLREVLGT